MSSEDVATIRGAYEAFGQQDIPAVMAAFDEEIEWVSPDTLPFGGTHHGHAGVGSFFAELPRYWGDLSVVPEEFIDGGDAVVVIVRLRGAGAGGPIDMQGVHLWRLRDGKALSFREYSDTARALQALGLPLPAAA
jgi:uncharacterized protein